MAVHQRALARDGPAVGERSRRPVDGCERRHDGVLMMAGGRVCPRVTGLDWASALITRCVTLYGFGSQDLSVLHANGAGGGDSYRKKSLADTNWL